jgi:hypothetical protein
MEASDDRIQTHPGREAHNRWESLRRIHGVLIVNERELLALIDRFQQDEMFGLEVMRVRSDGRTGMKRSGEG